MKKIGFLLFLAICWQNNFAQQFTEVTTANFLQVDAGSLDWGDYDGDGDLDLLLTGYSNYSNIPELNTKIYRNDGNDDFTEIQNLNLHKVCYSTGMWIDYDNDGDLDVFISGLDNPSHKQAMIYENNGNNSFTPQNLIEITGFDLGCADWGDFNNDGKKDLIITGNTGHGKVTEIYKNQGNKIFESIPVQVPDFVESKALWCDYDNDGYLDFFATGHVHGAISSYFCKGYGDGTFFMKEASEKLRQGDADWGDFDNDGDMDLIYTGVKDFGHKTVIMKNNGNNEFIKEETNLDGTVRGTIDFVDYDNDGWLDVFITGWTLKNNQNTVIAKLYRNNQNGTFSELTGINIPGLQYSAVKWSDYDNDGDLDLLVSGNKSNTSNNSEDICYTRLYKNNTTSKNTSPSTPIGLSASIEGTDVIFRWNKSTDAQTPQQYLTYNIFLYEQGCDNYIAAPTAKQNGQRFIVQSGQIFHHSNG